MKFVVVGLGSIGKRHKNNLLSLNHQVVDCHRNDDLLDILDREKPDGVLICNPTGLHLETAIKVAKAGYPMMIEKPLADSLAEADELLTLAKEKKAVILIGYNFRFQKDLIKLKQDLIEGKVGKVKEVEIRVGSYLPSWRPGIDYRECYSSKKELGGGVLLDLSHEIDYAVWMFGKAKTVKAVIKYADELEAELKGRELEIETEAWADLKIEFESAMKGKIHLDYVSEKYIRDCQVKGEKDVLSWDYAQIKKKEDVNQMYVNEIKHFIKVIQGKEKPRITLEESGHVLEIIEAARKSSELNKVIKL